MGASKAVYDSLVLGWISDQVKLVMIVQSLRGGLLELLHELRLLELLHKLIDVLLVRVGAGPRLEETCLLSFNSGVPHSGSVEFISDDTDDDVQQEDANGEESENHADLTAGRLDGLISVGVGGSGKVDGVGGESDELSRCLTGEGKHKHASSYLVFKHLINKIRLPSITHL